jgi:hypothetical protein
MIHNKIIEKGIGMVLIKADPTPLSRLTFGRCPERGRVRVNLSIVISYP